MKKFLLLWLLLTVSPFLAPQQTRVQVVAQVPRLSTATQFTPSLNLDFMKGVMPSGLTYTGSNGTRVNAQGYIESVAANVPRFDYDPTNVTISGQNLFANSRDFSGWGTTGGAQTSVINSNAIAPDNSATAQKLIINNGSGWNNGSTIQITYTVPSTSFTISLYVKTAGWDRIQIGTSGSGARSFFEIINGTLIQTVSGTSAIQNVGNGWYRLSITSSTGVAGSVGLLQVGVQDNTITTGDGVSGIYIWGAQLNEGSTALAYTPTTTAAIAGTRTATTLKGLLIEESRANLFTRSSEFDNAAWTKKNATVTANAALGPDGTLSADLVTWASGATVTGGSTSIRYFTNPTVSGPVSVYVKPYGNTTSIRIYPHVPDGNGNPQGPFSAESYTMFSLTGVGSTTAVAFNSNNTIAYVGNGWYRCATRYNFCCDGNGGNMFIAPNQTTDGTSGVYVWGGQFEPGSLPTSYIPTTTAAVTRAQDIVTYPLGSWLNINQGSFFSITSDNGATANGLNGFNTVWTMGNLGTAYSASNINSRIAQYYGNVVYGNATKFTDKVVTSYSSGSNSTIAASLNGTYLGSTTFAGGMGISTALGIGYGGTGLGLGGLNGHMKKLLYYPTYLPKQYSQSLTN